MRQTIKSNKASGPINFIDLIEDIRACTHCTKDLPLGPRPVLQANPKAKILIVGQAPGTAVHATGIPFNDPSGDRLRNWLGVDADQFYNEDLFAIVPMGFCYPGRGKGGDLPPRPECAPMWRTNLLSQLVNIELTIAIGRYAIDWHLDPKKDPRKDPKKDPKKSRQTKTKMTLQTIVAQWQDYLPSMVPLPHPSRRNTIWLRKNPWVEAEIIPTLRTRVAQILAG